MVAARWLRAHPNHKSLIKVDLAQLRAWVHQDFQEYDVMQDICSCDDTLRGALGYEHFWEKIVTFVESTPPNLVDDDNVIRSNVAETIDTKSITGLGNHAN